MPVEQLAYIKGLLDEWGRLTRGERDKPREGLAPAKSRLPSITNPRAGLEFPRSMTIL
jgi:hypothetical protein